MKRMEKILHPFLSLSLSLSADLKFIISSTQQLKTGLVFIFIQVFQLSIFLKFRFY